MLNRRHLAYFTFVVLLGLAYRPFSAIGEGVSSPLQQFEYWFFDSKGSSAGLVACVAAWMAWRRRSVFFESDGRPGRVGLRLSLSGILFLVSAGWLVWARQNDAPDLIFISLAWLLGSLAFLSSGWAGLRAMALPMAVLVLALPIPSPLSNEILWTLQIWSATWTAWLLQAVGIAIEQSGAHLARGEIHFLVVEGCSGLRSILTLTIVSLVVRELLGTRGLRGWFLVVLAPPIALALNILRIATIVMSSTQLDQRVGDAHLGQGLTVLAIGTGILFGLGHFLSDSNAHPSNSPSGPWVDPGDLRFKFVAAMFSILFAASILVEPWPVPTGSDLAPIDIPTRHANWQSSPLVLDYPFIGLLPRGRIESRVYQLIENEDQTQAPTIDLLIATDSNRLSRGSPISSKLMVPGREWKIDRVAITHNWTLGSPIHVVNASSHDSRALVYVWSLHAGNFWQDSIRSLLALERGPFERKRRRYIIQIAVRIGDKPEAERHSRRVLDRFVYDFADVLRAL